MLNKKEQMVTVMRTEEHFVHTAPVLKLETNQELQPWVRVHWNVIV